MRYLISISIIFNNKNNNNNSNNDFILQYNRKIIILIFMAVGFLNFRMLNHFGGKPQKCQFVNEPHFYCKLTLKALDNKMLMHK